MRKPAAAQVWKSAVAEVRKSGATGEDDQEAELVSSRKRVLIADPISPEGSSLLDGVDALEVEDCSHLARDGLKAALPRASALVVRSSTRVDADLMSVANGLEVVGRAGVGVDNIDVEEATRRGIAVLNAPGGNTRSTAELAFALLLAAARKLTAAERSLRAGEWNRGAFRGLQLHEKILGIVGAGRIGSEVAARGRAFGMHLMVFDPYLTEERAEELGVELVALEELLEAADFVTLHAPLTDETRGMIGGDELRRMKQSAVLVNAARGGLVDEEALAASLEEGRLAGAALDVYREEPPQQDHPLRDAPNLVMTPHLGAATAEARREVSIEIATAVRDALLRGDLRAALNAPRVKPDERAGIQPVLELGRRLGLVLGRLGPARCRRLEVSYAGPFSEILRPLAAAAMEGFLRPTVDRPLNMVNSLYVAGERGIEVSRTRMGDAGDYSNYVELASEGDDGAFRVGGALLGDSRHPRIVRIGDFHVDTVPRGTLLVIHNRDVPGVIGEVGSKLGGAGVNIAEYHQAREEAGGRALAVVTVDGELPAELLEEMGGLPNVEEVRQVVFEA